MKYFSLSYKLSAADYDEYDKIYNRDATKLRLRRLLPVYAIILIVGSFSDLLTTLLFLIFMTLTSSLIPILINKEFSKARADSTTFKKAMTVEFYDNHIITRLLPDENLRSETEKHYGFDKINRILESETAFYFAFSDNSLLVIPKKYVGQEEHTMIKNLIENLFRNKYLFLQTKN